MPRLAAAVFRLHANTDSRDAGSLSLQGVEQAWHDLAYPGRRRAMRCVQHQRLLGTGLGGFLPDAGRRDTVSNAWWQQRMHLGFEAGQRRRRLHQSAERFRSGKPIGERLGSKCRLAAWNKNAHGCILCRAMESVLHAVSHAHLRSAAASPSHFHTLGGQCPTRVVKSLLCRIHPCCACRHRPTGAPQKAIDDLGPTQTRFWQP